MRDLHFDDLIDLIDLLVGKELFHHQCLVSIAVPVSVQILELESFLGRATPLHYEDGPGPLQHEVRGLQLCVCIRHLSHPLVLDLSNLGVRVAHHGNQKIQKENHHDRDEDEEVDLANDLVVGVRDSLPDEADIPKTHEKYGQDGLHRVGHWMGVTLKISF